MKSKDFPLLTLPDEQLRGAGSSEMILTETAKFIDQVRAHKVFRFRDVEQKHDEPFDAYGVYTDIHEEDEGYVTHVDIEEKFPSPSDLIRKNRIVAEHGLFAGSISPDEAERNVRDIFIDYAQKMVGNYHYLINLSKDREKNEKVLSYMLRGAMPNYNEKAPLKQNIRHFNFLMQKRTTTSPPEKDHTLSTTWAPYPKID